MKTITLDQAVEKFKSGARMLIGEYRHGKVETINYRDKQTQKPASFTAIKHTVEIGEDSFQISERVPEGYDQNQWAQPVAKGKRCIVNFDKFQVTNGVGVFSGSVTPLVEK